MRELEYTVSGQEGPICVRQVMREKLGLSAKEISHAKQFEDGITAELDLRFGDVDRRRLHLDVFTAERISGSRIIDTADSDKNVADKNREWFHNECRQADTENMTCKTRVRVNEVLYPGETLRVTLHEMEDDKGRIIPVPGRIDIIYEDEDIILLNKPAGIVAHPSPGHSTDSLANRLAYYYEEKEEPHRIRIIGRLDKEASGVLLFAKTRMAARALRREAAYDKEYLAVCRGSFSRNEERGTINYPILKRPEVILKREISPEGETAVTHYHVVAQGADMALVRLKLETGRTHQIRLHMSSTGHPLIGDLIYNSSVNKSADELSVNQASHAMLHAERMRIVHPMSGTEMTFTADIPDDMLKLIHRLQSSS